MSRRTRKKRGSNVITFRRYAKKPTKMMAPRYPIIEVTQRPNIWRVPKINLRDVVTAPKRTRKRDLLLDFDIRAGLRNSRGRQIKFKGWTPGDPRKCSDKKARRRAVLIKSTGGGRLFYKLTKRKTC